MDPQIEERVQRIRQRVMELISVNKKLSKEINEVAEENRILKSKLSEYEYQMENLQVKSARLDISRTLDKNEKKQVKIQINRMIREIDTVIEAINKQ